MTSYKKNSPIIYSFKNIFNVHIDRMDSLSQTGPSPIHSSLKDLDGSNHFEFGLYNNPIAIKTGGSAQIFKRLISLSCGLFLLGKCHLDTGHCGSRSPTRSKFNHTALPGPVLTLISPWSVQEYDLPSFSSATLHPSPDCDPDVPADTNSEQTSSPTAQQIYCRFA